MVTGVLGLHLLYETKCIHIIMYRIYIEQSSRRTIKIHFELPALKNEKHR
jgi:hypothetical protein